MYSLPLLVYAGLSSSWPTALCWRPRAIALRPPGALAPGGSAERSAESYPTVGSGESGALALRRWQLLKLCRRPRFADRLQSPPSQELGAPRYLRRRKSSGRSRRTPLVTTNGSSLSPPSCRGTCARDRRRHRNLQSVLASHGIRFSALEPDEELADILEARACDHGGIDVLRGNTRALHSRSSRSLPSIR